MFNITSIIVTVRKWLRGTDDFSSDAVPTRRASDRVWATGNGIFVSLRAEFQRLGCEVHMPHPDSYSLCSPLDLDVKKREEGIIEVLKSIAGYTDNDGIAHDIGYLYEDGGELKKPIVLVLNTKSVAPTFANDTQAIGGIHWVACVILPKRYQVADRLIQHKNEQIIYLNPLSAAVEPYLKGCYSELFHALQRPVEINFMSDNDGTSQSIRHIIPQAFFNPELAITFLGQQYNSDDCGYYLIEDVVQLISTGSNASLLMSIEDSPKKANSIGIELRRKYPYAHRLTPLTPSWIPHKDAFSKLHITTDQLYSNKIPSPAEMPFSNTPESAYQSPLSPTSNKLTWPEKLQRMMSDLQYRLNDVQSVQCFEDDLLKRTLKTAAAVDKFIKQLRKNKPYDKQVYEHCICLKNKIAEALGQRLEQRYLDADAKSYKAFSMSEQQRQLILQFITAFPYCYASQRLRIHQKLLSLSSLINPLLPVAPLSLEDNKHHTLDYYDTKPYIKAMYDLASLYQTNKAAQEYKVLAASKMNRRYVEPLLNAAQILLAKEPGPLYKQHPSWSIPWWKFWRAEHRDWYNILRARRQLEAALAAHVQRFIRRQAPFLADDHIFLLELMKQDAYQAKFCRLITQDDMTFDRLCQGFIKQGAKPDQCFMLLKYLLSHSKKFLVQRDYLSTGLMALQAKHTVISPPFNYVLDQALSHSTPEVITLLDQMLTSEIINQLAPQTLYQLALKRPEIAKAIIDKATLVERFDANQLLTIAQSSGTLQNAVLQSSCLTKKIITGATTDKLLELWFAQPEFFKQLWEPHIETLILEHQPLGLAYTRLAKGNPLTVAILRDNALDEVPTHSDNARRALQLIQTIYTYPYLKNWFKQQLSQQDEKRIQLKLNQQLDQQFIWQKQINSLIAQHMKGLHFADVDKSILPANICASNTSKSSGQRMVV